jgi:hypothetical protein
MKRFIHLLVLVCVQLASLHASAFSGCPNNFLTDKNGYYGGFECATNFSSSTGSTDLLYGMPSNGTYEIVNYPKDAGGGGYLSLAPHSGSSQMVIHTSSNANDRLWYKKVSVVPGQTYEFCAWIANIKENPVTGFQITLNVNGTAIATSTAGYKWSQVCGTYTVPAGVTSIEISIKDPNPGVGPSHFLALDDICLTATTQALSSLGNLVWNDADGDGKKDAGEYGIAGITVKLYRDDNSDNFPDGDAVATTTTNAQGYYNFSNLTDGRYIAEIPVLTGYTAAGKTSTSNNPDNDTDNDNNAVNRVYDVLRTNAITLKAGTEPTTDGDGSNSNLTLDMALCGTAYIGDYVWNDVNNNGIQDAAEPGIAGATVTITYPDGSTKATTTDGNGLYYFVNLGAGTYTITFTTPSGYSPTASNTGSDDSKDSDPVNGNVTITLVPSVSNFTVDAGFIQQTPTSKLVLGNLVWNDANSNGFKDATETGISGLIVKLYADANRDNIADGTGNGTVIATTTTASNGTYYFTNLAAGDYIVGVVIPTNFTNAAYNPASPNNDVDNDNNGARTTAGELRSNYITLTQFGEPDTNIDGDGTNGNLTLDFALKSQTPTGGGGEGQQCFASPTKPNVVSAKSVWTYNPADQTVTIRTTLSKTFVDNTYGSNTIGWPANNHTFNHLVTSDELQLALYDNAGVKKLEFKMDYFSATSTSPTGYKTLGVTGGDGAMLVGSATDIVNVKTSLSENFNTYGYVLTNSSPATDNSYTPNPSYPNWMYDVWYEVTVKLSAFGTSGFKNPSISGLHASPSKTGVESESVSPISCPGLTLGNFVWNDTDGDGQKDVNEPGIGGIRVSLYKDDNADNLPDGAAIANTTTNASGYYSFTGLPDGRYITSIPVLTGYNPGGKRETSYNPDNDVDNDNNAINRVGDELYTNAITLTANQEPTTDGDDQNGNLTFDLALCGNGYIGDFVWNDLNANGLQDAGEPGIPGATVELTYADGTKKTAITDQDGLYNFANLGPGTYTIKFTTPTGYTPSPAKVGSNDAIDSDASNGTVTVTLAANVSNFNVDAGFYVGSPVDLGNMVWNDVNNNGIKDAGEVGIPGMTVNLFQDANADNTPDGDAIATAVTAADGTYNFTNLAAGKYVVGVVIPSGYQQGITTSTSSSPDNNVDNDNNGVKIVNGELFSNYITLQAGTEPTTDGDNNNGNLTLDFALAQSTSTGCPGNLLTNANGYYGGFEAGSASISATTAGSDLYNWLPRNGSYQVVRNINELGGGGYLNIQPHNGNYFLATHTSNRESDRIWYAKVNVTPGQTYSFSTYVTLLKNLGLGTRYILGLYVNGVQIATGRVTFDWTQITGTYTVPAGVTSIELSIRDPKKGLFFAAIDDICFTPTGGCTTGKIGDYVWYDANQNGVQDATEKGLPNVGVTLTLPDGSTRSTVSDAKGFYQFTGLSAATYTLTFNAPAGYTPSPSLSGTDRTKDSDPVSGSVTVTLTGCEINNNVDAGFYVAKCNQGTGICGPGFVTKTSTLIANGNFEYGVTNPAAGNTYTGSSNTTSGTMYTVTGGNFKCQGSYKGSVYPTGENAFSIFTGGNFTNANGVNQDPFPGDAAKNIPATNNFFYWNGNAFSAGQAALIWEQNVGGLIIGKRYTFRFYASNTYEPPVDLNDPIIEVRTGGTSGLPDGSTAVLPVTLTEAATSNASALSGWKRVEFSFTASAPNMLIKIVDRASGLSGDEVAITGIGMEICERDTDGDCVADVDDLDDDNDGILDIDENHGYDALADCDGDGIMNYLDPTPGCPGLVWMDCNNDGINDFFDFDKDGIINELDLDSDNDGILDVEETRDDNRVDLNRDGMVDGVDNDGDGILSTADADDAVYGGPGLTPEDLDRDGTPNYLDLDSDGDGISDLTEASGNWDSDGMVNGTDADGDGVRSYGGIYTNDAGNADNVEGFGAKGIDVLDTDNDGKTNPYDIDSDNDGITDNVEGQPTCSYKAPTGVDTDGDGLDDAYDTNSNPCILNGAGITPYDKDGDGTPDIYDLDTDNDGAADVNEGSGIYGNFVTNYNDTDDDGLIDQFDVFNIQTATSNFTNNVVHSNMGTNGNYDGPTPAGSNANLPQSVAGVCPNVDRDWRNVSILPVTLLDFKGNLNSQVVKLNWKVTNESNISHYVVDRSSNGTSFTAIGKVAATGNGGAVTNYTLDDNVSNLANTTVYYRLQQVEASGAGKYSNIIVFRLSAKNDVTLSVYPNPASTYFVLKVNAVKDGAASVRVMDVAGKTIVTQTSRVSTGSNAISFNSLNQIGAGTYNVQLIIDGQVFNEKLVIAK